MTAFTTQTRGRQNCKKPTEQTAEHFIHHTNILAAGGPLSGGADVDGVGPKPPPYLGQRIAAIFSPASENRNRNRRKIATLGTLRTEADSTSYVFGHSSSTDPPTRAFRDFFAFYRDGRTGAVAVRRGLSESLFLLNSGHAS